MKRTLAIFAKTPVPGKVKTRLSPPLSLHQAAELYSCMLLDTIARTRSLGIDIVIFYEGDREFFRAAAPEATLIHQQDGGLGIRLEHAFDALAELGYGPRVVIGTDGPDLPLHYMEKAFQLLDEGTEAVFGPAEDGGYYLVALKGAYGAVFRDIPWSGEQVLDKTLQQAEASGLSVSLLPHWFDVDSYQDLLRPGLSDPVNGAPLTRAFIAGLLATTQPTAGAV